MSLYDIFSDFCLKGGAIVLVLMTIIQITPLKLNPWTHIAKFFGNAINGDLSKQVKDLTEKVESIEKDIAKEHQETNTRIEAVTTSITDLDAKINDLRYDVKGDLVEAQVIAARSRILIFGDEVSHGQNHSKEHFRQILDDITKYNTYCAEHPNFANDMTKLTSQRIKDDYSKKDQENNFL